MSLLIVSGVLTLAGAWQGFHADTRRRKLSLTRSSGWSVPVLLDVWAFAACAALVAGFSMILIPTAFSQGAIPLLSPVTASLGGSIATTRFLWTEGRRQVQLQRPAGLVCGEFLIIGGGWLLMETFLFFSHAHFPDWLSIFVLRCLGGFLVVTGGLVVSSVVRAFLQGREEHRVLKRIAEQGEFVQSEWIPPTLECPDPGRWQMLDPQSAELEVLDLLESLIRAVKPELIVETGTFIGHSAIRMAQALKANGAGRIITIEFDPEVYAKAREQIAASGLSPWIECRNGSSLETRINGQIDLLFSDSDVNIREQEVRRFLQQITPRGLVMIHDASSHFKVVREAALRLESEGLLSVILLSTPRGLCIAQKREGRS